MRLWHYGYSPLFSRPEEYWRGIGFSGLLRAIFPSYSAAAVLQQARTQYPNMDLLLVATPPDNESPGLYFRRSGPGLDWLLETARVCGEAGVGVLLATEYEKRPTDVTGWGMEADWERNGRTLAQLCRIGWLGNFTLEGKAPGFQALLRGLQGENYLGGWLSDPYTRGVSPAGLNKIKTTLRAKFGDGTIVSGASLVFPRFGLPKQEPKIRKSFAALAAAGDGSLWNWNGSPFLFSPLSASDPEELRRRQSLAEEFYRTL